MLSIKKRQALLRAGFSAEDLERILAELSENASGRERKEQALTLLDEYLADLDARLTAASAGAHADANPPAIVDSRSLMAGVVNRLISGEAFRDLKN